MIARLHSSFGCYPSFWLRSAKAGRAIRSLNRLRPSLPAFAEAAEGILRLDSAWRRLAVPSVALIVCAHHCPPSLKLRRASFVLALLGEGWWSRSGSNRRPRRCERRALSTELLPPKRRFLLRQAFAGVKQNLLPTLPACPAVLKATEKLAL